MAQVEPEVIKKQKIDNDNEEEEASDASDKFENNIEEIPAEKENNQAKSETVQKMSDIKFRTGVTQLKMPGHTGFLTFATVPPDLKRPEIISNPCDSAE